MRSAGGCTCQQQGLGLEATASELHVAIPSMSLSSEGSQPPRNGSTDAPLLRAAKIQACTPEHSARCKTHFGAQNAATLRVMCSRLVRLRPLWQSIHRQPRFPVVAPPAPQLRPCHLRGDLSGVHHTRPAPVKVRVAVREVHAPGLDRRQLAPPCSGYTGSALVCSPQRISKVLLWPRQSQRRGGLAPLHLRGKMLIACRPLTPLSSFTSSGATCAAAVNVHLPEKQQPWICCSTSSRLAARLRDDAVQRRLRCGGD